MEIFKVFSFLGSFDKVPIIVVYCFVYLKNLVNSTHSKIQYFGLVKDKTLPTTVH